MPRIASLHIESFRGIPGTLDLDLRRRPSEPPSSFLILGDNGSGKSSIVDALEFVLRASLLRRLDPDRPVKRRAASFAISSRPYARITYDDGSTIARGGPGPGRFGQGIREVIVSEPSFSQAPIVLRRADILGFWGLAPERRKLVFFDYFRSPDPTTAQRIEASSIADAMQTRAAELRDQRDNARESLAQAIGDEKARFPNGLGQLRAYREKQLVPRFGTGRVGRSGEELIARDVQRAYRVLLDVTVELEKVERAGVRAHERAEGTSTRRVQAEVEEILDTAGVYVSDAFRHISDSAEFVESIQITSDRTSNSLDVGIRLLRGEEAAPEDILSEANLDLLSLLLFVAIAEASVLHGQAKLLVLDDVFQSVDAVYRDRTVRYIVQRLRDWQLFITTHDRLWFALLAEALRQGDVPFVGREIVRWSFESGPTIRDARLNPSASLDLALEASDPVLICSSAGLLAEEIADRLSWTLGASVPRRPGDRYTLDLLWRGVYKKLRKTTAAANARRVDESIVLRNLVGAHFNEWARSVSMSEAQRFGIAVTELFGSVYCEKCGWLQPGDLAATEWKCKCGEMVVGPPIDSSERTSR